MQSTKQPCKSNGCNKNLIFELAVENAAGSDFQLPFCHLIKKMY